MKNLIIALLMSFTSSFAFSAQTELQCAEDRITEDSGVRVNVLSNAGELRANLIFGTTVSGTMYQLAKTKEGFAGNIRNKAAFTLELLVSEQKAQNSNILGYRSVLKATYPTALVARGAKSIEVELVCGKKISERWN